MGLFGPAKRAAGVNAAGMNKIRKAARYIKANMPLGAGYTLTDMEAWDVRSIPEWVGS